MSINDEIKVIIYTLSSIIILVAGFFLITYFNRSVNPFEVVSFDHSNDLKVTKVIYGNDFKAGKLVKPIDKEYILNRNKYTIRLVVDTNGSTSVNLYFTNKSSSLSMNGEYIHKYGQEYVFSAKEKYYHDGQNKSALVIRVIDENGIKIGREVLPYKIIPGGIIYTYDLI